ncbi:hypothetical protein ACROYT_G027048 [Oculina patagonica]
MVIDRKKTKHGGREHGVDFTGDLFAFRYARDYYPISLVKTADLDPCKNYIFGYHPHGFIPDGLVISFGTKVLGFQNKFPGITPHIGGHSLIFWSPIFRELALWLRVVDVGSESCRHVLTQMGPGHSMVIIPGGAAESLDSCCKEYILTLNRRRQFIKMALETGSSLVPVFGFGQNDSFHIPENLEYLKSYKNGRTKLVKWLKVLVRNTLVTFCGKYKVIPALPCNKPITVVVGSPIHVEKVTNPNDEQIQQLHAEYVKKLTRLFEENRIKYHIPEDAKLIIQ